MNHENTAPSAAHTDLLAGELYAHKMQMSAMECVPTDGREPFTFQHFYLGLGDLLIAQIQGDTHGPDYGGYPSPSIEQAQAIHAELIRRWNAHTELLEALERIEDDVARVLNFEPISGVERDRLATAHSIVAAAIAKATTPAA